MNFRNIDFSKIKKGFLAIFGIVYFSTVGCSEEEIELKQRSADSLDTLVASIKEAYINGDQYTIIEYMNNESLRVDLAEAITRSLSLGSGNLKDFEVTTNIIRWEDFHNNLGIPGSFKGKKLRFTENPKGVIQLLAYNEKGGTQYTIELAYFVEEGRYRLCGIEM